MRSTFERFLALLRLNWKKCPWIREQTAEFLLSEMEEEIGEARAELRKGDRKKLADELGDIAWDYFNLLMVAEKKHGVPMKSVFSAMMKKVRHRKPYLFRKKPVDTKEAVRIWKKQKAKEKR
jgi:NTP pyrophosphatase (non-canonical NTP hydrolase)